MSEPVDPEGSERGGDHAYTSHEIKGNLTLQGRIEVPTQETSRSKNLETQPAKRPKSSIFEVVMGVLGLICATSIGLLLAGIGYLQYTVYSQQAEIMGMQAENMDRPWIK